MKSRTLIEELRHFRVLIPILFVWEPIGGVLHFQFAINFIPYRDRIIQDGDKYLDFRFTVGSRKSIEEKYRFEE